ncbi:hypothetical protein IscW_ISCW019247 [Ixodes scapularis]|uniref:Helicase ATP-binding domain-containing protein n=1 Tax=Ixodes scapularis TaxID=6945 RepID=B7PW21_IXOSC|nr:hypothetical protein IscW_ISCW019247 [Ixodes scapularis]|eukprot:XP_002409109.1 hypothetical protein IscW_ISCW019247 [Ixodes scapularis]
MCILSSRERTCIHPRISRSSNKNEECKELLDDVGCRFQGNLKKGKEYPSLYESRIIEPYDLEDLVRIGTRQKASALPAPNSTYSLGACPYYWSLDMVDSSDIVFCPYNYLIDPVIRKCLSINLDNAVVVLDEAHNIEDISREVMSLSITQDQIRDIIMDLEDMIRQDALPDLHHSLARVMSKISVWISQHSDHLNDYRSFEQSGKVWSGNDIIALMIDIGLGPEAFESFRKTVAFVTSVEKDPEKYQPMLLASTSAILQNLVIILDFFYRSNMKYMSDFRAAVVKSVSKRRRSEAAGGWHTKSSAGNNSWTHTLSFWCLNPAVAMSDIKDKVHSLIVASGTLSPMESFESELDMPFKSQLQAKHVIPPDGNTGMWDNISEHKCIFVEPQKADAASFDASMVEYCRYATREAVDVPGTGALLLAVCRGKVSEGMDFADNTARAVVTVGIPFPNVKDIQVDQKRKYNDQCSKSGRPVMCGNFWYETQAFRALNQALGRCIRHRLDWGALIVVDQRFSENGRYQKALSKWISDRFRCFNRYEEAMGSLKAFMDSKMSTEDAQCVNGAVASWAGPPTLEAMMVAGTSNGYASTGLVNCDHSLDVTMSTGSASVFELTDDSSQEACMIVDGGVLSSSTVEMSTLQTESTVGQMDHGVSSTVVMSLDASTADCTSDKDSIILSPASTNTEKTVDSLNVVEINPCKKHCNAERMCEEASGSSGMSMGTPAVNCVFDEDTIIGSPTSVRMGETTDSLNVVEITAYENRCSDDVNKCGQVSSLSVMSVEAPAASDEDTIILSSPLHSADSPEIF